MTSHSSTLSGIRNTYSLAVARCKHWANTWCLFTKESWSSVFLLLHTCHQIQELPSWSTILLGNRIVSDFLPSCLLRSSPQCAISGFCSWGYRPSPSTQLLSKQLLIPKFQETPSMQSVNTFQHIPDRHPESIPVATLTEHTWLNKICVSALYCSTFSVCASKLLVIQGNRKK